MNNNPFKEWIESIPVGEYKDIRLQIIRECHVSRQIFNHWKLGNSKVPLLAQPIINKIAGKEIFQQN